MVEMLIALLPWAMLLLFVCKSIYQKIFPTTWGSRRSRSKKPLSGGINVCKNHAAKEPFGTTGTHECSPWQKTSRLWAAKWGNLRSRFCDQHFVQKHLLVRFHLMNLFPTPPTKTKAKNTNRLSSFRVFFNKHLFFLEKNWLCFQLFPLMACILASKAARCWPSSPKSSWANHQAYSVNNNQTPRMWYGWRGRDKGELRMVDFLRTLFVEVWIPQKHVRSWHQKKWMGVGDSWNAIWHLRATPHTWAISSTSMGSPACTKTKNLQPENEIIFQIFMTLGSIR